jgi:hypothetical protein
MWRNRVILPTVASEVVDTGYSKGRIVQRAIPFADNVENDQIESDNK